MSRTTTSSPIEPRIGQVFIPINDMQQAIAWYSALFGLEPGNTSHAGNIYDIPVTGETFLVLDSHKSVTSTSVQPICMFPTNDMDAALAHLREINAEITSEPQDIGSLTFHLPRPRRQSPHGLPTKQVTHPQENRHSQRHAGSHDQPSSPWRIFTPPNPYSE